MAWLVILLSYTFQCQGTGCYCTDVHGEALPTDSKSNGLRDPQKSLWRGDDCLGDTQVTQNRYKSESFSLQTKKLISSSGKQRAKTNFAKSWRLPRKSVWRWCLTCANNYLCNCARVAKSASYDVCRKDIYVVYPICGHHWTT